MKKNLLLLFILMLVTVAGFSQPSWTVLPVQIPESIQSINFSDNDHGYITCTNHKVYKTSDGGLTWTDVSPNFAASVATEYKAICTLDSLTAFAGRDFNQMIRTYDGGITWDTISVPIFQTAEIAFLNDNVGFLQGGGGFFRTVDKGITWTQLSSTFRERGLFFITDSIILSGGNGNYIYKTTDQGLTWTTYDTKMSQGSQAIYFFDANHGIAVDGDGYWATTWDQGLTWDTLSHGMHLNQVGIHFVTPSRGYKIYSNSGASFLTSNTGGVSWQNTTSGNCSGLTDMHFPSRCVGYICGLSGNILKYTDLTCLAGVNNPVDDQEVFSVFPNPATDHFTVTCENEMPLEFILYDISSRQLLMQTFSGSALISSGKFAKGIYLYEIRSKSEVLKKGKLVKE